MKTLNSLFIFVLLSFSIESFPQSYTSRQVRISYRTSTNILIDEILVGFTDNPTATTTESRVWDARTLNVGTYAASFKGTAQLAIQTRPLNFDKDTVRLLFASTQPNSFKLSFGDLSPFVEAKEILLLDRFTGTQKNLKADPNYSFSITTDPNSQGAERFKLVFVSEQFIIRCPSAIVVNNISGRDGAYVNFESSVISKCGAYFLNYSHLPNSYFPIGRTLVTVTASDICNNQFQTSFSVVVKDAEAPVFNSINSLVLTTNPGLSVTDSDAPLPVATDNSGAVDITATRSDGESLNAVFSRGTTTIWWKATDASGNSTIATQTVLVKDVEPPVFSTRFAGQFDATIAGCRFTVADSDYDPIVTDNCLNVHVMNDLTGSASLAGAILPAGITNILWTATDDEGNIATLRQTITVSDDKAPLISPKTILSSYKANYAGCTLKILSGEFDPNVTDDCSEINVVNSFTNTHTLAGAVLPTGTTIVNWTATDANGNMSHHQQVINVTSTVTASIPAAAALVSGVKPNSLYLGYSPASALNYSAAVSAGNYNYQWSVSKELSIAGSAFNSAVRINSAVDNAATAELKLLVTDAAGCSAISTKVVHIIDVRCGARLDKITVCSPQGKVTCVNNNQGLATNLVNGFTLGNCNASLLSSRSSATEEYTIEKTASIGVYPNPSKGMFVLQLTGYQTGKAEVSIIDMLGRPVASGTIHISQQKEQMTFDLTTKSAGVYHIRVSTENGVQLTKVVLAQ